MIAAWSRMPIPKEGDPAVVCFREALHINAGALIFRYGKAGFQSGFENLPLVARGREVANLSVIASHEKEQGVAKSIRIEGKAALMINSILAEREPCLLDTMFMSVKEVQEWEAEKRHRNQEDDGNNSKQYRFFPI